MRIRDEQEFVPLKLNDGEGGDGIDDKFTLI